MHMGILANTRPTIVANKRRCDSMAVEPKCGRLCLSAGGAGVCAPQGRVWRNVLNIHRRAAASPNKLASMNQKPFLFTLLSYAHASAIKRSETSAVFVFCVMDNVFGCAFARF